MSFLLQRLYFCLGKLKLSQSVIVVHRVVAGKNVSSLTENYMGGNWSGQIWLGLGIRAMNINYFWWHLPPPSSGFVTDLSVSYLNTKCWNLKIAHISAPAVVSDVCKNNIFKQLLSSISLSGVKSLEYFPIFIFCWGKFWQSCSQPLKINSVLWSTGVLWG